MLSLRFHFWFFCPSKSQLNLSYIDYLFPYCRLPLPEALEQIYLIEFVSMFSKEYDYIEHFKFFIYIKMH